MKTSHPYAHIQDKFSPNNFRTSPLLRAFLGALFNQHWSNPRITGLKRVGSCVFGQSDFSIGYDIHLASWADTIDNIRKATHTVINNPVEAEQFVLWASNEINRGFESARHYSDTTDNHA